MAEYPVLPLFTDAFIGDTTHLNAMQTGAYLMLLIAAWRTPDCRLPDDDKMLARMARMDGRSWVKNKAAIMAFWKKDAEHKWYQGRLVDERKNVEAMKHRNAEAGKASALKRKGRHATTVATTIQRDLNPPSPSLLHTQTIEGYDPLKASVMFEEFWLAYPKKTRKGFALKAYAEALTKISHDKLMAALTKYRFKSEIQFVMKPEDWLRGECWHDETGYVSEVDREFEQWKIRMQGWRETKFWMEHLWGAPPNSPNCQCPKELLAA